MKVIENWWLSIDKLNFILIISLGITGVILSFSINENFYYINRHSIFFIISMLLLVFFSNLGDKNIRRVSLVSFFILIFMLLLVFLLDFEIKGAKRWLKIFSFTIQPSEIIKPFFIILTAWCIAQTINSKKYYIILLFVFFAILLSFIILQPDLGMTILIATTFFCQLFVAGLPLLLVFVALGFLITMTISSYYLFDHVKKRISSFFDNGADTHQIDLSIQAFQSGGILGKGPGQGILKESIPDASSDFIFAVAGEELGFVGIPTEINVNVLDEIIKANEIPVIAPMGLKDNKPFNINADTAAGTIAKELKSRRLLLMTDIEGVIDRNNKLVSEITPDVAKKMINEEVIKGGMIPKINTCIDAVNNGVRGVVIIDGRKPHSILFELFSDKGSGTLIRE